MSELTPDEYPTAKIITGPVDYIDEPTVEIPGSELTDPFDSTEPTPVISPEATEATPLVATESSTALLGLRRYITAFRLGVARHKVKRLEDNNHTVTKRAASDALVFRGTRGVLPIPVGASAEKARVVEARNRDVVKHQPQTWLERRIALYRSRQVKKSRMVELRNDRIKRELGDDFVEKAPRQKFQEEDRHYGRRVRNRGQRHDYKVAYRGQKRAVEGNVISRTLHLPVGSRAASRSVERAAEGRSPLQRVNTVRLNRKTKKVDRLQTHLQDLRQAERNMRRVQHVNDYFTRVPKHIDKVEAEVVAASPIVTVLKEVPAKGSKTLAQKAIRNVSAIETQLYNETNLEQRKKLKRKLADERTKRDSRISKSNARRTELNRRRTERGKADVTGWM